jgi:HlyD family secretion protein
MTDVTVHDPAAEWYAGVPRSIRGHAILGLTLMALAFGGFGLWSFTAPLAAAVIAQGSFVATGRNQIVQHLEGGIIETLFVSEGDVVAAGDGLLSLDQTSAEATERELFLREMRLQAMSERLLAEYQEKEELVFSVALLEAEDRDLEVAAMLDSQRLTFDITRKSLLSDIALLESNVQALRIRDGGYGDQLRAYETRADVLAEEIADKQHLLERGLVRKSQLNALLRTQAEADGQVARLVAELAEVQETLRKHEEEIVRARAAYRQTALDELGPVAAELESVREKSRQARNVLDRSVVRAPVSGTVVRMHYHTAGGVIEPGRPIAEILPSDAPLIIEAQVARTDIDSVKIGQDATIRLIALSQRTTPVLTGEVFYLSADALLEDVAGQPREVYLARVSIPVDELERVRGFVPTPGMPVEVMIQTRARTFAEYITKPITDSFSRAFREQ